MNRSLLIIGILLMVAGFFLLTQGAQILTPIAEVTGLAPQVQTERPILAPTVLTVPASNYAFLPANLAGGVTVKGSLQVSNGQEVALYVMNEGNFTAWQTKHTGQVLLAKPMAISYNFTITPTTTGTYYFIFDNQDTTRHVVVLSISVLENTYVLNPLIENAGFELFAVGILFFAIGARIGKRKPKPDESSESGVRCRFCGAKIAMGETFCAKCGRAQK